MSDSSPTTSKNVSRNLLTKMDSKDGGSSSKHSSGKITNNGTSEDNMNLTKNDKNGILKKKVAIASRSSNGSISASSELLRDDVSTSDMNGSLIEPKKRAHKIKNQNLHFQECTSPSPKTLSLGKDDQVKTGRDDAKKVTESFRDVFKKERKNYQLKIEYYMACLGVPIAFNTLWRFPQLIVENGGGAFLFAYLVLILLIGIPMYVMEAGLGQFSQLSVVHMWRCAPLMHGVGVAMAVLSLIASIYNSQIVAYAVHYFFASFVNLDSTVLWGECKSTWKKCYDITTNNICSFLDVTIDGVEVDPSDCHGFLTSSSRFYWKERVLRLDWLGDIGDLKMIHWDLLLCVALVWILTAACLVRGIRSCGKVSLVTGFLPITILLSFMVFSVQKDGAHKGLQELFRPEWNKLAGIELWQKAAEQVFFSLSLTYGSVLTFSSYKKFRSELQISAVFLTLFNILLSLMCSIVVFSLYGALAHVLKINDVSSLIKTEVIGIETVFVFFPEVIGRLFPFAQVWSIFFFLMLIGLGLHAQFSLVETSLTVIYDALPNLRCKKHWVTIGLIIPLFLLTIPLSSSTGLHILNLIGISINGPNILLLAIFEVLSLQCIYGVRKFSQDLSIMLPSSPSFFWKVCWIFVTPLTLVILFICTVINWEKTLVDDRRLHDDWTLYFSWAVTLLPLAMIPLALIFMFFYKLCTKEPLLEPSPCWGPGCPHTMEVVREQKDLLKNARRKRPL